VISSHKWWVVAVVLIGLCIRILLAWHQPFTNDEGAYLYDAKLLAHGTLPSGDVLTKSPVVIGLFALAVKLSQASLYATRVVTILFGMAAVVPLFLFTRRVWHSQAACMASTFWLLAAGPASWYVLGHTQAIAVFFGLMCLWVWSRVVGDVDFTKRQRTGYALLAGLFFVLAFLSRKTAIAILPVVVVMVAWESFSLKEAVRLLVSFVSAVVVGIGLVSLVAFFLYGAVGFRELWGGGYGGIIYQATLGEGVSSWGSATSWPFQVVVTAALPMVIGALLGLGFLSVRVLRALFQPRHMTTVLLIEWVMWLWVGVQTVLYLFWPTFLPEYWADFWPVFCLLSAYGLLRCWEISGKIVGPVILLLIVCTIFSFYYQWHKPWTGMFRREALYEAADFMREKISEDEPIFTAAVIVPYVSGHHVVGEVAHPLWYRFDFIPDHVREAFLPPLARLEVELTDGQVAWVLREQLTDYAYFFDTSPLRGVFFERWQLAHDIQNQTGFRSNTLYFWERK
jgi:hypothetical protein